MTAKCLLRALEILTKDGSNGNLSGEHDEIFVGGPKPKDLSKEDREEMENLDWTYDKAYESWRHFT